jgi:hypothetical protein
LLAEAAEFGERAVEGPFGGIEAALEATEDSLGPDEGFGEGKFLRFFIVAFGASVLALEFRIPDFGLGLAEPAEEPVGGDDGIDEDGFLGTGGLKAVVIAGPKGFEFFGIFAADDLGLGVDAGSEAFMEETALPATVRGPVLFCELRRFAWIWRMLAINAKSTGG